MAEHKISTVHTAGSCDLDTAGGRAPAMEEEGSEHSLAENREGDCKLPDEDDTAGKGVGKPHSTDTCEAVLQKAVRSGAEQGSTVASRDPRSTSSPRESKAVAEGSGGDTIRSDRVNRSCADSSNKGTMCASPQQHGCGNLPGMSTVQESVVRGSLINPGSRPTPQTAADVGLSDGADLLCPSSSSTQSVPSQGHLCSDDAVTFSSSGNTKDNSSFFAREPTFTCPVCCKPVGCINLTDFNAHIDKCLQLDSSQSTRTPPKSRRPSGSQQNAASKKSKVSPSPCSLSSPQSCTTTQRFQASKQNARRASRGAKTTTSDKKEQTARDPNAAGSVHMKLGTTSAQSRNSSAAAVTTSSKDAAAVASSSKATATVSSSNTAAKITSNKDAAATITSSGDAATVSSSSSSSSSRDAAHSALSSVQNENRTSAVGAPPHEDWAYAEVDSTDYMVCPLCGAERADWTLETFNQHLDACLNRDTIAHILREQRSSEEQPRKR